MDIIATLLRICYAFLSRLLRDKLIQGSPTQANLLKSTTDLLLQDSVRENESFNGTSLKP